MAVKFFIILAIAAPVALFKCFDDGFSREAIIVYAVAVLIATLAVGIFVIKNRRALNELTWEPTEKNVRIFQQLLTRRKGVGDKS